MLIMKFGGTSVATKDRIATICEITKTNLNQNPILVVSAVSKVTDLLLSLENSSKNDRKKILSKLEQIHTTLINGLLTNKSSRQKAQTYLEQTLQNINHLIQNKITLQRLDKLCSYGELLSSYLITLSLEQAGIASVQVPATKLIITNNHYGSADFLPEQTRSKTKQVLNPLIEKGIVPVVTGFIAATPSGQTTTLGRGGSDYSASILGFALHAKEVQIWTDVDGIFTADPRLVKTAMLIPHVSYKEASEMAFLGAKVLHPRTIRPAIHKNIPVRVLNSFNLTNRGTVITENSTSPGPKAVSFKRKTTLINIVSADMLFSRGFLAKIFAIFAAENISIDLVSVSEVSVSVTLDFDQSIQNAISALKEFANVQVSHSVGVVSLVGEGVGNSQEVISELFHLLGKAIIPIRMISQGASDVNISLVLNEEDIEKAVRLVHDRILLQQSDPKDSGPASTSNQRGESKTVRNDRIII